MAVTDPVKPRSILRRATALGSTLLTIGLAAGLVMGGTGLIAERAATETEAAERVAIPVLTVPLRLQESYEVTVSYRGRVEAGQRVDIGFEAGGTLVHVLVDEGDRVSEGDILARLDTRSLQAERAAQVAGRDALLAQSELARRTADRQRELAARDFASGQRLDEAELTLAQLDAEVRRADAAITALDIALEKAVLTAPFDAVIGRRAADDGARLAPGQPVVELYQAVVPRVRVGVPADLAATLAPGAEMPLEIGGETLAATLLRSRSDIAPGTRTRDLLFSLPEGADRPEGSLATLTLTREVEGAGAWVPAEALGEGLRGLWTVFVVVDGIARREAVELVHSAEGQAYIRGHLRDGTEIVAAGPHRIADGQAVAPTEG